MDAEDRRWRERHEALTQSVELLQHEQIREAENLTAIAKLLNGVIATIDRIAGKVEEHDHRLTGGGL